MIEQAINQKNYKKSIRKFGLRDKVGYLLCEIGDDMLYFITTAFLMVFYTDVLFISPAVVGIILMIGRYIDSRKNSEHGRFKPMIIRFGPILAIATVFLFAKIPGLCN